MGFILIFIGLLVVLAVAPQLWVAHVIRKHSQERPDFSGTGAEFARFLLGEIKLQNVSVDYALPMQNAFEPETKTVRLAPEQYSGRSLAAVVIAAHEIGHAIQDAQDYAPLRARTRAVLYAAMVERILGVMVLMSPVLVIVAKTPAVLGLVIGVCLLFMSLQVLLHVFTLQVEFDASFARAMPLLEEGRLISPHDLPGARELLRAAAWSYVANAALNMLLLPRLLRGLRL